MRLTGDLQAPGTRRSLWLSVLAIWLSLVGVDALIGVVSAAPDGEVVPARPAPGGGYIPPPPPPAPGRTPTGPTYAPPVYVPPPVPYVAPPGYVPPPVPYVAPPGYVSPPVAAPGPVLPPNATGSPDAMFDEEPIAADEELAPDDPNARPIIQRIEFSGNLLYNAASMETRMRNKVGRPLDRIALEADVAELRKFFSQIEVVKLDVPGGILLRFLVAENPLVVTLTIFGADEMDDAEIQGLLRTREGFPLSRDHLAQDREDIVAAYKLRGFHFADVPEPRVTELASGGLKVDFIIVEGPKVEVSKVLFRGRRSISEEDLLEVMQTRSPSFFENVFGAPLFREEALREDLVAMKQLYRDDGFLDAEVALDDWRFSDDNSKVEITIAVEENQPYTVGTVQVQFGHAVDNDFKAGRPTLDVGAPTADDLAYFTEARVRDLLGLKPGARYSGKTIAEGTKTLREKYYERSFHDVAILPPVTRGREQGHVVDLDIRIIEGAKFRLSRIDFVGNEATQDQILRRDVHIAPGGFVDRNELDRGLSRLQRLGYFDRSTLRLDDAIGPDGEPLSGWKTATYEVVEGSTRSINVGAQVDTNGGVGVFLTLHERNFDISRFPRSWSDWSSGRAFKGAGQDFRISLAPNTRITQFEAAFREPRLFGSHVGFDSSVYSRFEFREGYRADRFGYSVGLSYPFIRASDDTLRVEGGLRWRHEWVDINDIRDDAVPGAFLFAGQKELRRIEASIGIATLDDLRKPTWSTTTRFQGEYAGDVLGGDLDFYRLTASHDELFVLHENLDGGQHRLQLRGLIRYAKALSDTPELPPFERYFLGGRTLRGFDFRGVGPHVNGDPTGGEFAWSGSIEYEYPIIAKRLAIATFLDAGTVSETIHTSDATKVRMGIGVGLRLVLPMLSQQPIALDFTWDVLSESEDETSVFSFSFSRTF